METKQFIYFGVFVLAAIVACFLLTYYQIYVSQHQWCDALNTLTSVPVPKPANPTANPSREEAYTLYSQLVTIRRGFGCG